LKSIIFGGSGFVGSHVADALADAGHQVVIFDLKPSPYLRPDQEMIEGDIANRDLVRKAVKGCDIVYNMAGIADLDDASTRSVDTIYRNIMCNAIILEACVDAEIKRFIYPSTVYVYSEKGGFYRCSKQAAETYVEEFHRQYGLDFTILRYGTLYGPRADQRNSIYRYLYQALTQGKIVTSATGEERREYIHVRDAARLSLEILDEKYANTRLTLTGHQSIYFQDLINMIGEILNDKVEIVFTKPLNSAHYEMTPYSYVPKTGYKLTSNLFTDLGQGLVECLAEIHSEITKGEISAEQNELVATTNPDFTG